MAEASAKELRPVVRARLREGLADRGWSPKHGRGTVFSAGAAVVEPPLSMELAPDVEGDRYGGLRFGLTVTLLHTALAEELADFPADALPAIPVPSRELPEWFAITSQEAGRATTPSGSVRSWRIGDTDEVGPVLADWFAVLDGPIDDWIGRRRTVPTLIDVHAADPTAAARNGTATRMIALASLTVARPDVARAVVAAFETGLDDSPERMAAFERELASRDPRYGALQRH